MARSIRSPNAVARWPFHAAVRGHQPRVTHPDRPFFKADPFAPYGTGHGSTFQMSAAYSAIVRSLENLPEQATLRSARRDQASGSTKSASIRACV